MPAQRNPDGTLDSMTEVLPLSDGLQVVVKLVEIDGRLVPARIELGADLHDPNAPDPLPITTGMWRAIPIGHVVDAAIAGQVRFLRGLESDSNWRESAAARALAAAGEASIGKRKPGRPPLYDRAHFERVANVYKKGGRAPTKAVAEHFGVSKATAAKWVAKTRGEFPDLLPPVDS